MKVLNCLVLLTILSISTFAQQKAKVRLRLEYFKTAQSEYLTAKVLTRIDRKYRPVIDVSIDFFLMDNSESGKLGSITTNDDGIALLTLPDQYFLAIDTLTEINFIASLSNNLDYHDKEDELEIRKVSLEFGFIDQDSLKWVQAIVFETDSSDTKIPKENVKVNLLVERPLSWLPIKGENSTTNEDGTLVFEFPDDLPGDESGKVNLMLKIEDNDHYGNIENNESIEWGIPIVFDDQSVKRSLWAAGANAPVLLLILINTLIAATWGTMFYIVYKIYKISRV